MADVFGNNDAIKPPASGQPQVTIAPQGTPIEAPTFKQETYAAPDTDIQNFDTLVDRLSQMYAPGPTDTQVAKPTAVTASPAPDAASPSYMAQLYQAASASDSQTADQTAAAIKAKIDATKKDATIMDGVVQAYDQQQQTTEDAMDKLNFIHRFTDLPDEFGQLGQLIFGTVGMFDNDYSAGYQQNRIAAAQDKTQNLARQAEYQSAVNNAEPAVAQLQAQLQDNQTKAITSQITYNKDYQQYLSRDLEYRAGLSQFEQQTLRNAVDNASDDVVRQRAASKGPEQGVWQVENYRRIQMRDAIEDYNQSKSMRGLQNILQWMRPDELAAGIAQADDAGSAIVVLHDPWTKRPVGIPVQMAKSYEVQNKKAEDDFNNMTAVNYADRVNLPQRLSTTLNSTRALAQYNPKLLGIAKALSAVAAATAKGTKLSYSDTQMLNGILTQGEALVKSTTDAMAKTAPTKEAKAAIANFGLSGGKFSPQDALGYLSSTLPTTDPATSPFSSVLSAIRKDAEAALNNPKDKNSFALQAMALTKPDKANQQATLSVLNDPDSKAKYRQEATATVGNTAAIRALQLLGNSTQGASVWKRIMNPANLHLFMGADGTINMAQLVDQLNKAEIEATVAGGPNGRNYRGVFRDTFRQALQRVRIGAKTSMGGDLGYSLVDKALMAHLFGNALPYDDAINSTINTWNSMSSMSSQRMNSLLQQDVNGRTLQDANRRAYNSQAADFAARGGIAPNAFVKRKLDAVNPDQTQSATGTRLTVQQIRDYEQQHGGL